MKTLKSIIAPFVLGACLLFPAKASAEKEIIFDQTFPVTMTYEYGKKTEEKLKIQASLDQETDTLYLGIYTQDYNRKDWKGSSKELLPINEQYTQINNTYSKIFIFKPSRVKIDEQSQRIYSVSYGLSKNQQGWYSDLQPYDKDQRFQFILETVKKAAEKVISKIPYLGGVYDKYLEDAKEKEEEYYDKILEDTNPDYVRTQISPYIPKKLIGYTETAREYTIKFDIGNMQDEIPMYLWMRIDLGDPSIAGQGCFPNRYGKLENVLIKFTLNESNIKRDELYTYFLHEEELKKIDVAKKNVDGTQSNPAIITISTLSYEERKPYEVDNVVRIGMADYTIQGDKDSAEKDLSWGIVQFKSSEDLEYFINNDKRITYPLFFKDKILSYIVEPTMEEISSPVNDFSEEQYVIYADLILAYSSRTGMDILLDKDAIKSRRLLKQIENYKTGR